MAERPASRKAYGNSPTYITVEIIEMHVAARLVMPALAAGVESLADISVPHCLNAPPPPRAVGSVSLIMLRGWHLGLFALLASSFKCFFIGFLFLD